MLLTMSHLIFNCLEQKLGKSNFEGLTGDEENELYVTKFW